MSVLILRSLAPAPDTTPDQFTFDDQSGVALSSTITSTSVPITGLTNGVTVTFTASGGSIDKNGDNNFQAAQNLGNGDSMRARVTSSGSNNVAVNCIVTAAPSGVNDTFTATTLLSSGGIDDEPAIPGNAIWVDIAAANDSGTGTQASPKKFINSGVALLSIGGSGTVVIKDGTYTAAFSNSSIKAAPNWAGQNVIRAENPGGVLVTGGFSISGNTNWFCQIRGIKFDDGAEKDITGGNLKVFKCAFARGATSGNTSSMTIGTNNTSPGAHHILLEDCWVYGPGGRYDILIYNSQDVILRRVVTRFDGGYNNVDGAPEAAITQYDSQRVECQNCIAIDGLGPRPNYVATFYNAANGTESTPNATKAWRGCLAIKHLGYIMGSEGQANITAMTAEDVVGYAGTTGVYGVSQLKGTSTLYQRFTIIGEAGDGFGVFGGSATVRDAVIKNCTGNALNGVSASTSAGNGNGSNSGITVLDPYTNGLLYPPRIETGSTLKSGGTAGGQRGAEIVFRMGTSGALYGESGFNTLTTDLLWPWPFQTRIKSDMSSVAGLTTPQATRGFCASGEDLTHYIFNLLGNGNPYP